MIDYTTVAGLVLYFLVARAVSAGRFRPLTASLIVVGGVFALTTSTQAILLSAYDAPLWQLVGPVPISKAVLQFGVAYLSFIKLSDDESYTGWILWSMIGCIGIFILAPLLATSLFVRF